MLWIEVVSVSFYFFLDRDNSNTEIIRNEVDARK